MGVGECRPCTSTGAGASGGKCRGNCGGNPSVGVRIAATGDATRMRGHGEFRRTVTIPHRDRALVSVASRAVCLWRGGCGTLVHAIAAIATPNTLSCPTALGTRHTCAPSSGCARVTRGGWCRLRLALGGHRIRNYVTQPRFSRAQRSASGAWDCPTWREARFRPKLENRALQEHTDTLGTLRPRLTTTSHATLHAMLRANVSCGARTLWYTLQRVAHQHTTQGVISCDTVDEG